MSRRGRGKGASPRIRRDQPGPRPAGLPTSRPVVAIVGRPNVGKSTLFNRLVGRRLAIVEDVPGVTRDRHYADAFVGSRDIVLVDTGGFDPTSDDRLAGAIASQVRLAIDEADVVVCVLDGVVDPTPGDIEAVSLLRRSQKPVVFVANKADSPSRALGATELYRLGMERLIAVSALHGVGMDELDDAIGEHLAALAAIEESSENPDDPSLAGATRLAFVGRPNAGKSSLANRLIGEDRLVVDDAPGTTRDAIDVAIERDGKRYVLVDTAGMRKKHAVEGGSIEGMSVLAAIRALERIDVAVIVVDATQGIGEQDLKVLALAVDRGRACVVVLNKWDVIPREEHRKKLEETEERIAFARWVPIVALSAKTGRGVTKMLEVVDRAHASFVRRVPTAQLNRFFEEVLEHHPPPTQSGKSVRLYYVTQAAVAPPTFVAISNHPDSIAESYRRYVAAQIRKAFDFEAVPVRVHYRAKRRRELPER